MKLNGQTILIVEDNADDRFIIERTLKRMATGLGVQFVANGQQAVAYLDGRGFYADRLRFPYPSFVVTDLAMGKGDGFSVLRHIRGIAHPPLRTMVLSDWDDPAYVRRAYDLGADRFYQKPQYMNALPPIISNFLNADSVESVWPSQALCSV